MGLCEALQVLPENTQTKKQNLFQPKIFFNVKRKAG